MAGVQGAQATASRELSHRDRCARALPDVFRGGFDLLRLVRRPDPLDAVRAGRAADAADAAQPRTDGSVRWLRHSLAQAMQGIKQQAQDRVAFVVGYTPDGNQCLEESHVTRGISQRLREILDRMPGDSAQRARLAASIEHRLQARYPAGTSSPAQFLPHASGRKAMQGVLPDSTDLLMVDTACSSSLYAVDIGVKGLLTGKCDVAVC